MHPNRGVKSIFMSWLVLSAVVCCAQSSPPGKIDCPGANNSSASPRYRGSRGNAPPGNVSKLPIRTLLYAGSQTRIYTRYMPWFGDSHHRDVGYRSDDRQQVARQVADMISRGISGAIVDWYGPNSASKNESTVLVMREAERQNFEFARLGGCRVPRRMPEEGLRRDRAADLRPQFAAEHFEGSPAYVRFDGRPALFFFGLEKYAIDWHRVRRSLPLKPLFFFRNSGAFANPDSDGGYSWIAPESAGPGDPLALKYLERFYSKAQASDKIAMGSAYKGFDDSEASWGKGASLISNVGKTWLATFAVVDHFYSSAHQLPALIIPTWNDYEEGTEIETGIDNCVKPSGRCGRRKTGVDGLRSQEHNRSLSVLARQGDQWGEAESFPPDRDVIP